MSTPSRSTAPDLRLDQSLDRAQRARLTGPVGTEKPKDLTTGDLKADAVDGRLGAVRDRQVPDLQDDARVGWGPSTHVVMDALRGPRSDHETIQHRSGDQLRNATGTIGRRKPISQWASGEQLAGDDLSERLEGLVRLPIPSRSGQGHGFRS